MKNIPFALFAFMTSAAFAQAPPPAPAKQGAGHVVFVSIDNMPIPIPSAELQKAKRANPAKADDGFSTLETAPQIVRQFYSNIDMVTSLASVQAGPAMKAERAVPQTPLVVRAVSDLKLGFRPAAVHRGELIGASPQGTIVNDSWTGVERFYRIPGAGIARLSEIDLKATSGMFYMLKEAINTQVAGQPAISKVFTDGDGKTIEEVLWVNEEKLNMLTFAPQMEKGRFGLAKLNARISANSLAQELR